MAVTQAGRNTDAGSSTRPEARDFLNIDANLSDEERGVRERIRSFVQERIKPNIKGWYDEAVYPSSPVSACSGCTSPATGVRARARSSTASLAWSLRRATQD